jgi:hypothetical protein
VPGTVSKEIRILDPNVRNHIDTFRVVMLSTASRTIFPEILEIFGPEAAIKFLDVFGGLTIKVPERSFLEQAARDTDIYHMMSSGGNQSDIIEYLATKYDMEPDYVRTCYQRVLDIRHRYNL